MFQYARIFLLVASCATESAKISGKPPAKTAKTISLSSGEVIHDLNGEWECQINPYGYGVKPYNQIIGITQEGKSFVGVQMMGDEYMSKGSRRMDGVLAKDGFDYVNVYLIVGSLRATGPISEDGKSIVLDGEYGVRFTLTRK